MRPSGHPLHYPDDPMPPLPLVYLIVDPAPLRQLVTVTRLIVHPTIRPAVIADLQPGAITPAEIDRLVREGTLTPVVPGSAGGPARPRWLRLA